MWFDQAADQEHPAAKSFLGMLRITGIGTEQDIEEGLRNLNEAADSGYFEAQYYLDKLYYKGCTSPAAYQRQRNSSTSRPNRGAGTRSLCSTKQDRRDPVEQQS